MERLLKERARFEAGLDEDDQSLAVRAKSDREAFGLLYDRYVTRVYGYCRRLLPRRKRRKMRPASSSPAH